MSLLTNKIAAITLASTLGAISLGNVASTSINHNLQIKKTTPQISNTQKSHSKFNQQDFIKLMQPYVKVENNKYVMDTSIYKNPQINVSDINLLKKMLVKANEQIVKNNLKNVSVTNGAIKQEYNGNGICLAGINSIHFYWWGFYLYLNSETTNFVANTASGVAITALSAATDGAIDNPVILSAIAAEIGNIEANSPECQDGCVISWNYALGFQEMWAQ